MDWRHIGEVLAAAEGQYSELKNLCVWTKTNGGMGSFYRSQHELVFVYQNGKGSHVNNVELGKNGRYRTNVWSYPGVNTFGADRNAELAMHPTVKPVALVADAIRDASKRNAVVLDAFGGSGTTLVAAARTGRRGFALEISPHYVDTIVKRVADATGERPVLHTGDSFDNVAKWRRSGIDEEVCA
jgi:DNA modification methylase